MDALSWPSKGPKISGKFVEKIIGHCIHSMMLRRELLAIFRSLYQFVHDNYWHRRRLWPWARSEANWAASLLAVPFADLRRPWDCTVFASNASLSGIGVCKSDISHEVIERIGNFKEAWRYKTKSPIAPRKATVSHDDITQGLDPFLDIETVKPCSLMREDPFELNDEFPEIDGELVDPKSWDFVFASHMKFPEAITVLELRAIFAALRHKLRLRASFGKKRLHFSDNLSAVLCAGKGRSSSFPMLGASRRLRALLIAANCQLLVRWIPSEWNVADHGSRLWERERVVAEREARKSKKNFKKNIRQAIQTSQLGPPGQVLPRLTSQPETIRKMRHQLEGKTQEERSRKRKRFLENTVMAPRFPGQTPLEQMAVSQAVASDYTKRLEAFKTFEKQASRTSSYQQVRRELQHLSESSLLRRHRRLRRLQDSGRFGGCKTGCKPKRRPAQSKEVSARVGKAGSCENKTAHSHKVAS